MFEPLCVLPEIVENGVTGIVVEAERPDQLAEAVKKFVRSPHLIKTMGRAARQRIRSEFALDRCVGRFVRVIEELNVK